MDRGGKVNVHLLQTDNALRADKKTRDKAISVMTKWISQQRALVGAQSSLPLSHFSALPSVRPQLLVIHFIGAWRCATGAISSDAL